MNTEGSHEIVPEREIPNDQKHLFIPLTDEETAVVAPMSAEDRQAWLVKNIPTKERLYRYLKDQGLPRFMWENARKGVYDDFDDNGVDMPQTLLIKHLSAYARFDIIKLVKDGVFDGTLAEGEAWAARQPAEVKDILNKLNSREGL